MNIKDLEWKLGLLADAAVFDAESKAALRHARDIVATLRAALNLANDSDANRLVDSICASLQGERPGRTDQQIIDQTNRLAREVLRNLHVGYDVPDTYRFDLEKERHPRAANAWAIACVAQELLTNTNPQDALDNLEE